MSSFDNFIVTLEREVSHLGGITVKVEDGAAFIYDGPDCVVMAEPATDHDGVTLTLKNDHSVGMPHLIVDGLGWVGAAMAVGAWVRFQLWTRCTGVETRVIAD